MSHPAVICFFKFESFSCSSVKLSQSHPLSDGVTIQNLRNKNEKARVRSKNR